jgi:hypothetical protein
MQSKTGNGKPATTFNGRRRTITASNYILSLFLSLSLSLSLSPSLSLSFSLCARYRAAAAAILAPVWLGPLRLLPTGKEEKMEEEDAEQLPQGGKEGRKTWALQKPLRLLK